MNTKKDNLKMDKTPEITQLTKTSVKFNKFAKES